MDLIRSHVMVCGGTNCSSSASGEIIREFERQIAEKGLEKEIKVVRTGCFGMCEAGPVVIVYPEGAFYARMTVENVTRIVDEHLVKGRVVKELLYKEAVDEDNKVKSLDSVDFYKKQRRVALRNCGVIDPENIDEYIAFDGYKALGKVLTEMTPQGVIDVMLKSGLRGRGGAGFPTGMKWKFAAASQSDKKYVCCNADEGDPGAFMDRSILEGDPHVVIEAMAIAAYAIGADQGYIYCRAEYPIAVKRLQIAIRQAREYGLLGKNIFGTDFCFDVDVRLGAGAFVCGEETALMTSIEGKRGEPRPRPPFPAVKGLFGKPTILNNVETYARRTVKSVRRLNKVYTEVTFTEPLPDGVEPMHVVAADDEYPEVLIKGCRMRGNRARGLLLGSRNRMVIEDNYFHIAGAAILIEGDANYWYEQSGVRDVVIRRNLFENGNYGSPGWGSACIAVGSGIPDRETSRYHRNIRVEGNTFRVFDPRIVNLYCVDGFVFTRDNVIEYTDDYPYVLDEKRNFITRNCDRVVVDKKQTDKK